MPASSAAIYGTDDRRDVYEVPEAKRLAPSIAVAVAEIYISKNGDTSSVTPDPGSDFNFCATERFRDQSSMGLCTGFLVGPRWLVTAGHCASNIGINNLSNEYCQSFQWIFDYNLKNGAAYDYARIPANKIYRCARVIRAENLDNFPYNIRRVGEFQDFAVIELDRDVEGISPLPISYSPVHNGDPVFTIGHPWGLPAKYSGRAPAGNDEMQKSFSSTLDTLGGNSGGPVFNDRGEVVGILAAGHQFDIGSAENQCTLLNRCDDQAQNCTHPSQLFPFSEIQRIEQVLPYLSNRTEARAAVSRTR